MESTPAGPESNIRRGGKVSVEHRSRYALAAWFLEEIVNLHEIKKIAEDIEKKSQYTHIVTTRRNDERRISDEGWKPVEIARVRREISCLNIIVLEYVINSFGLLLKEPKNSFRALKN